MSTNPIYDHFCGIDISKKTFDLSLEAEPNAAALKRNFSNNLAGFDQLKDWLLKKGCDMRRTLFCMENTGIYHRLLANYLLNQGATVWVENPVEIKWSGGLQRGKNDAADAQRIMQYAIRHQDKLVPYKEQDKTLQKVADLLALRDRLKRCLHTLRVPIKELKAAGLTRQAEVVEKASRKSITAMHKEIKALEQQIKDTINKDPKLKRLYEIATSVRCVGFVAATSLIVFTQGFTRFQNPKQFAAFAGIAPFEFSSGTSVKGKTKVHPMANKNLKTILHLCAVSAVRHNEELKTYYKRKVDEGKNKMTVLNAIRNKIIHRVFACIRDNRSYEIRTTKN